MSKINKIITEEINNVVQERQGGEFYEHTIQSLDSIESSFDQVANDIEEFRSQNGYTKRKFYRLSKDAQKIRKAMQNLRDIMKKTYYKI